MQHYVLDVTETTTTDIGPFAFCSGFSSSHVLSNALVLIKPTSANICIWSTPCPAFSYPRCCSVANVLLCSSPQGFPSHILYLVSDLFMWYVKNVRLHFFLYKPAALNRFQLCQNMYCELEAATSMYLKESFSDALWVSLAIQWSLYLKNDFACEIRQIRSYCIVECKQHIVRLLSYDSILD